MNSKLFCSAVMFVVFICIVANFNNNKGIANKLISLFLLLAAVSSILSSSKSDSSLENFVSTPQEEQKRIKDHQDELSKTKVELTIPFLFFSKLFLLILHTDL